MHRATRRNGRLTSVVTLVLALSLVAAACGGKKAGEKTGPIDREKEGLTAEAGESGLEDAGKPVRGGKIIYGLEAESTNGFCLPEGQLAISGMMVVRAIYDTLTVPNEKGEYIPYLAKSVEPSDDYKTWTITVRDNIKFHDGTDLTGEVVKNNLDAYRGAYPARKPLLFAFVFNNIDTISSEGQTVTVKTKVPWVAFPAFLFYGSRVGIMAQAQLDDDKTCSSKLIGTGPFKFESWTPNDKLVGSRNEDYWQIAPDGEPYPYADSIEFRPLANTQVRIQSLQTDDGANIIHTSDASKIATELLDLRNDGKLNMMYSEEWGEVSFVQLNSTKPPFDDPRMRKALAMGADRSEINDKSNEGLPTVANGAFAPGSVAFMEDPGFPKYDPEEAQKLVEEYVNDGGEAKFNLTTTSDPETVELAEMIQQRAQEVGVKVNIIKRKQAELVDDAIGKQYEAMLFRNYPGGDPDINHVWWYGNDNPVNFGGYDDPDINRLLDDARSNPDQDQRTADYKEINEIFAKQVYSVWSWYTPWAVVEKSNVHGILGPPLPGEDPSQPGEYSTDDPNFAPNRGLATGHSLLGLWVDNS